MNPTCFLINEHVALDAGALTQSLSIEDQAKISHIFFSHSHIDHLCTLPFMLDNIFSNIQSPVSVFGPAHTIDCIKKHLFNNQLWPDFSAFSNEHSSILELKAVGAGETIQVDGLKITSVPMVHTVECYGYLVDDGDVSAFFFGDTRSIDHALPFLEKVPNLEIIFLEASFPNRLRRIAEASCHLTTQGFAREAGKLPKNVPIVATHMKPDVLKEIRTEIVNLGLDNISLAEQDNLYELGSSQIKGKAKP